MENRRYTQFGTFSVTVLSIIILLISRKVILEHPANVDYIGLSILIICLLFFYRLTILVSDTSVSFKLGIGFFRKSYNISDIKSVRPVRNSLFQGIGIRILHNGWLYNVSGLKAIELEFKNRRSVIRIGTDRPEEISAFINSILEEKSGKEYDRN